MNRNGDYATWSGEISNCVSQQRCPSSHRWGKPVGVDGPIHHTFVGGHGEFTFVLKVRHRDSMEVLYSNCFPEAS